MTGADFPAWFAASVFGGVGCAVLSALAIAGWALIRRRGLSRQVAPALLICLVASALDSLMVIWMQERLGVYGPALGSIEVSLALLVTALAGWTAPLGAMVWFVLFAAPESGAPAASQRGRSVAPMSAPPLDAGRYRPALPDGIAWAYLTSERLGQDATLIHLTNAVIILGRDPAADLTLSDDLVSRFHAELRWENGSAWIKDLGSLNGTRLNHVAITGKMALRDGDALQFGDTDFRFLRAAPKVPAASAGDGAAQPSGSALDVETRKTAGVSGVFGSSAPPLALVWSAKTGAQCEWTLRAPLTTLGRDANCVVVIPDDSVSRLHAQITRQPEGYYIVDVESSNGVFLNGEQVTSPQRLRAGDVIQLGDARLTVRDMVASGSAHIAQPVDSATVASAGDSEPGRQATATRPRALPPLPPVEATAERRDAS